MLQSLHIENMAVISTLSLELQNGLSAITGETGAGKSVMIDCIQFLLGGKPRRELVRRGTEKGTVCGLFTEPSEALLAHLTSIGLEPSEELLLQRTLTADGKTKAYLNGRMITQAMLRDIAKYLVSIHGQNDNQLLLQETVQKQLLDSVADFGGDAEAYRTLYARRNDLNAKLTALCRDASEVDRLRDILTFQIADIDKAHLKDGEEALLLARRDKLQNAEKIAKQTAFVYHALHGSENGSATLILEKAAAALTKISGVIPEAAEKAEKLLQMRYEVEDIACLARDYGEDVEGDPTAALDRVEGRLDTITKLCRKYGGDIPAVLAFRAEAAARLAALEGADDEITRLREELKKTETGLKSLALRLHAARVKAAAGLVDRVLAELRFLDMPSVRFEIDVTDKGVFGADGTDAVTFTLAANKGEEPMPLSLVASGGELARVMLALRCVLNDRDGVETAVFDEVDTGISGKTARKIGIKLAEISKHTQVLCVTHSAQIASLSTAHYKISKSDVGERTASAVTPLDEGGRVAEIARILGGISVTDAQIAAARELIAEGAQYR